MQSFKVAIRFLKLLEISTISLYLYDRFIGNDRGKCDAMKVSGYHPTNRLMQHSMVSTYDNYRFF